MGPMKRPRETEDEEELTSFKRRKSEYIAMG
jgi:hypothetical protein